MTTADEMSGTAAQQVDLVEFRIRPRPSRQSAPATSRRRPAPLAWLEDATESMLFGSRWILAPLYVGLVGGLVAIVIKFGQAFWGLFRHLTSDSYNQVTLGILEMLDITLLANLVLIVVFAGYETFVSKIGAAEDSEDRPHWMGHIDFSGLKMKLIGSIVAISVIGLLQDFLNTGPHDFDHEKWRLGIHLAFLLSGVMFATMDYIADKRSHLHDA